MGIAASRMAFQLGMCARLRSLALLLVALAFSLSGLAAAPAGAATNPVRAAFYYPWSTTAWPASLPYEPSLGRYDSSAEATVQQQVKWMSYAGLNAAISSWDGQGSATD